jgi:glyoxylase-like metal-dependent hydrolase (beta-lactamase superfamily II)
MKMWKTNLKNEIFQVLSGRTNCYLIPTNTGNILVDTGVRSSFPSLKKHIDAMHLATGNVDYLVLTHTHFDHCQNASAIKEYFASKIVVGQPEADFALQGYTPIPQGTQAITRFLVKIGNKMDQDRFGYDPFEAGLKISERHQFMEDPFIELLPTPGHSAGSISLIIDDVAIVGDALFGMFKHSVFPPFADDVPELIHSWEKLLNTDCRLFLPGHGQEISRGLLEIQYEKYSRKFSFQEV